MPLPGFPHTHRAEIDLKQRCRSAPAWSFRTLTATESHTHRDDVRRAHRRLFAFVPGYLQWRATAIGARRLLPRDSPRALTPARSTRHLATSRSDSPSCGRPRFALVTKW